MEREKQEVTVSRLFDAPREIVYKVFTEPEHKKKWWRCNTITNVSVEMDVRNGGLWRIVQQDETGKQYVMYGEYLEIIPQEKIVNTYEFDGMPGHVITETTTFEDHDGKTMLTITSQFQSIEDLEGMIKAGMESGTMESLEHANELIIKLQTITI